MRQLIMKDFAIQKKTIALFSIFVLGFSVGFVGSEREGSINAFFLYMVCLPIYSFVTRASLEEEKNNTMRFLDSLPVSRDSMVCARYASVFAYTSLNLAAFALIDYLSRLIAFGKTENLIRDMAVEIFFILIFLLVNSIYLPFIYRFGYKRASMINIIAIALLFGIIGAIGSGFKNSSPDLINRLNQLFTPVNAIAVILLVLALYLASMEISIVLFKKRNLY